MLYYYFFSHKQNYSKHLAAGDFPTSFNDLVLLICLCVLMLPWQITGLTNNSYFDGAHEVRHCVRKHPDLGRIVLEVAKVYTKDECRERFLLCISMAKACDTSFINYILLHAKHHCVDYTVMQKELKR